MQRRSSVPARFLHIFSGLRSYPAAGYVIIYTIDGADVVVLHVLHGRRDIEGLIGP